jgi:hypothetical protein
MTVISALMRRLFFRYWVRSILKSHVRGLA